MQRGAAFDQQTSQGMTHFVVGGDHFVLLADRETFPAYSHSDSVLGELKVFLIRDHPSLPDSLENSHIDHIFNVSAGKSGCRFGKHLTVNVVVPNSFQVTLENVLPSSNIGERHLDRFVEAARAQYGGVHRFLEIGGAYNDNVVRFFEPIHFGQNLVDGVSGMAIFVIVALASDRIDFIDENDGRGVLTRFFKELTDPRGTEPHEHLIELRARLVEKAAFGFAGERPSHQGLTGSLKLIGRTFKFYL